MVYANVSNVAFHPYLCIIQLSIMARIKNRSTRQTLTIFLIPVCTVEILTTVFAVNRTPTYSWMSEWGRTIICTVFAANNINSVRINDSQSSSLQSLAALHNAKANTHTTITTTAEIIPAIMVQPPYLPSSSILDMIFLHSLMQ